MAKKTSTAPASAEKTAQKADKAIKKVKKVNHPWKDLHVAFVGPCIYQEPLIQFKGCRAIGFKEAFWREVEKHGNDRVAVADALHTRFRQAAGGKIVDGGFWDRWTTGHFGSSSRATAAPVPAPAAAPAPPPKRTILELSDFDDDDDDDDEVRCRCASPAAQLPLHACSRACPASARACATRRSTAACSTPWAPPTTTRGS